MGRRRWGSYIWRLMIVVFLIVVVSCCAFCLRPTDELSDRIAHICTMMITAAAYSTVITTVLPQVGYMTLLDRYFLGCFFFLGLEVLEISFIGAVGREEEDHLGISIDTPIIRWLWQEA